MVIDPRGAVRQRPQQEVGESMSAAPTVESDEPAENAWRFQQALGKPSEFPTPPTASTTGP